MKAFDRMAVLATVTCQMAGVALNVLVLLHCEFVQSLVSTGLELRLGLWKYSVQGTADTSALREFDTGGTCRSIPEGFLLDSDGLIWQHRTAQVCSIVAIAGGSLLVLLTLWRQSSLLCGRELCQIPLGDHFILLAYILACVGTSLVWLVKANEVCTTLIGGCQWGQAAWMEVGAQLAYLLASVFHSYLPPPVLPRESYNHPDEESDGSKRPGLESSPTDATWPSPQSEARSPHSRTVEQAEYELERMQALLQVVEGDNHNLKQELATVNAAMAGTVPVAQWHELQRNNERLQQMINELRMEVASNSFDENLQNDTSAERSMVEILEADQERTQGTLELQQAINEKLQDELNAATDHIEQLKLELETKHQNDPNDYTWTSLRDENRDLQTQLAHAMRDHREEKFQWETLLRKEERQRKKLENVQQSKMDQREEELTAAKERFQQEHEKFLKLQQENRILEDRILKLEEDNAKQSIALVKATLGPTADIHGSGDYL